MAQLQNWEDQEESYGWSDGITIPGSVQKRVDVALGDMG